MVFGSVGAAWIAAVSVRVASIDGGRRSKSRSSLLRLDEDDGRETCVMSNTPFAFSTSLLDVVLPISAPPALSLLVKEDGSLLPAVDADMVLNSCKAESTMLLNSCMAESTMTLFSLDGRVRSIPLLVVECVCVCVCVLLASSNSAFRLKAPTTCFRYNATLPNRKDRCGGMSGRAGSRQRQCEL